MRNWCLTGMLGVALAATTVVSCYSPSSTSSDARSTNDGAPDADLRITWPVRYLPAGTATMLGSATVVIALRENAVWNVTTGQVKGADVNQPVVVTTPIAAVVPQFGGPDLHVVILRSLRISGGVVTVYAPGPAIIIAQDITIDADAGLSVNAEPSVAGVNSGMSIGGSVMTQGGGGGGFLSSGGSAGAAGGAAYSIATIFRGGSQGGRDPQCSNGGTSLGGSGAGAILLYASQKITMLGLISANGMGGFAGRQCSQSAIGEGGGGGGSGGAIVLQAPILDFGNTGRLFATGGGGGGGGPGNTGLGEFPGTNGGAGNRIGGTGGAGGIYCGKGGNGGSSTAGAGNGISGVMYPSGNMGTGGRGGGGGAAGYIELRTRSTGMPMEAAPPVARVVDGP